jgi:FHA domain
MSDPRLNSIHLEAPRRQLFRHAREMMLKARGQHTLNVEKQEAGDAISGGSKTQIEKKNALAGLETEFCLMDVDCVYPLKFGINTVGRSSENDVVIPDAFVSRRHCAILVHHSTLCELFDTASKNGTFLNGSKIAKATRLRTGDEIRMCDRNYVFISKHDAAGAGARTQTIIE